MIGCMNIKQESVSQRQNSSIRYSMLADTLDPLNLVQGERRVGNGFE